MRSFREPKRRRAALKVSAAAIATVLGAASCGEPAPPAHTDQAAEARATKEGGPLEADQPKLLDSATLEREIPLDRLLEVPEGVVAETSLDTPLVRLPDANSAEPDAVLPEWLHVDVDIGSERTESVDPSHDVQSRKVGASLGWTGNGDEEGERGPTIAIEAEVHEDTTEAHPDEKTRDESIGLRVIIPFRATGKENSR
jgi:hypothetical protein